MRKEKDFPKPVDSENEAFIIGACLLDPDSFPVAAEIIRGPADFQDGLARVTWAALRAVYAEEGTVSLETVEQELRRRRDLEAFPEAPEDITDKLRHLRDGYGEECAGNPARLRRRCNLQRERAVRWQAAEIIGTIAYDPTRPLAEIMSEYAGELMRLAEEAAPVSARPARRTSWNSDDLISTEIAPTVWAVEGFIPEGLTLVGGRPKKGKSVLALQLLHAIASAGEEGGYFLGARVERGPCLYLALEDSDKRLQKRMRRQRWPLGADCEIELTWPVFSEGGMAALAKRLREKKYLLVVIDTLLRFLEATDFNDYARMGADLAELQRLALETSTPILAVTHSVKAEADDISVAILGSTSITGTADQFMLLRAKRGGGWELELADGRDVEGQIIELRRNAETLTWELATGEAGIKQDTRRADVLRAVEEGEGLVTCTEIAETVGMKKQNVTVELKALADAGKIVGKRGGREVFYRRLTGEYPS
jgi:DNA-binding transcriptional ArsR family regulator